VNADETYHEEVSDIELAARDDRDQYLRALASTQPLVPIRIEKKQTQP